MNRVGRVRVGGVRVGEELGVVGNEGHQGVQAGGAVGLYGRGREAECEGGGEGEACR